MQLLALAITLLKLLQSEKYCTLDMTWKYHSSLPEENTLRVCATCRSLSLCVIQGIVLVYRKRKTQRMGTIQIETIPYITQKQNRINLRMASISICIYNHIYIDNNRYNL